MMPTPNSCWRCAQPILTSPAPVCPVARPLWRTGLATPTLCSWLSPIVMHQLRRMVWEDTVTDPYAPRSCGRCQQSLRYVAVPYRNTPSHPRTWRIASVCPVCHAIRSVSNHPIPAPQLTERIIR